jgi:hypothetical protein
MMRKFPVWVRIICWAIALVFLVGGAGHLLVGLGHVDGENLFVAALFLPSGAWCARFARLRMVASEAGVKIKNPVRSYEIRWRDVAAVFPTDEGLALALHDGRVVVAFATAKARLPWNRRHDEEARAYFETQIARARSGP